MKTLDEVINALEICGHDESPKCPYFDTEHWCCCEDHMRSIYPLKNDALYHLNKYRMTLDDIVSKRKALEAEIDRYQEAVKNCEKEENRYLKLVHNLGKVGNEPLTWDALKQMEGKPVWVEHKYYKIWLIVKDVYEETIVLDGNGFYTQYFSDDNEKETRWQAFRKERE